MLSYPLFVDGRDVEPRGWTYCVRASEFLRDPGAAFALKRGLELGEIDPAGAPDSVFGRVATGADEDNRRAVEAAARAAVEWGATSVELRREVARTFHEALAARFDELVEILVAEGHPRRLARWEANGMLAGSSPQTLGPLFDQFDQRLDAPDHEVVVCRKADGVVCLNPPQNASGSNSALGVGALLAGNALVVKAPRTTPLSVLWLYRDIVAPILEEAGAPAGTLNVISGDTRRIIRHWVNSPHVDDVFFFGDSDVGLKIGQDCVSKGKKPVLELAGNDGVVVWHDADVARAAETLCECFYGSSQICMVPKYVVAHPAVANELLDRLVRRAREIRPGLPEDDDVLLSPVLKTDKFFDFLAEATSAGADVLAGGRRVDLEGRPAIDGLFLEPTVLRVEGLEGARELRAVREETFFPMLPIVVAEDLPDDELLAKVIAFVNGNAYGLRNSLWTASREVVDTFVARVKTGGLLKVNTSHIGFVPGLATHGGTGKTGGAYGELNFPMLKTSHLQGVAIGEPTRRSEREGRFQRMRPVEEAAA